MKPISLFLILFIPLNIWAEMPLRSPIPSTVPGINIPNTHILAKGQSVILRGMAPLTGSDVQELAQYPITDVLIFRNDSAGETGIAQEMVLLHQSPSITNIVNIPFPWKNISDFKTPCEELVRALQMFKVALNEKNKNLFFHCTVGEDRTGLAAGVYRVLFEKVAPQDAFQNDMCAYGYSRADPTKPEFVSQAVDANLTPIFLKMVALIEKKELTVDTLNPAVCAHDPASDPAQAKQLNDQLGKSQCRPLKLSQGKLPAKDRMPAQSHPTPHQP